MSSNFQPRLPMWVSGPNGKTSVDPQSLIVVCCPRTNTNAAWFPNTAAGERDAAAFAQMLNDHARVSP